MALDFTDSDVVMEKLTKELARLCKEVTDYKIVEANEEILPKVEGPFILLDLSAMDQMDWDSGEQRDDEGNTYVIHNYTATYTLTAYRGKPHWALARILQSFKLPFLYDKYFPYGSPYAYSSSSTISRMRIPLNAQYFEKRARVQIIFNVAFVEGDYGVFEDLEEINITTGITYVDETIDVPSTVNVND